MRQRMPEREAPRILIIRRRYLGDIVLLGALLRNLRLHWPGADLRVLVERRFADVLTLNPDVNGTLLLPAGLAQWPGFLAEVRRHCFTHVVDVDNTEKTALIGRLSGATTRIVLHRGHLKLKLRWAYTQVVLDPSDQHEQQSFSEFYCRALEPLGVPKVSSEVRLIPRADDVADLRRFVGASQRVLLVHPGSRSPMRIWPADRFAGVIDYVQDELDTQVVLIGGPTEDAIIAEIREKVHTHLIPPPGPLSIQRFAALAQLSDVMLCHDSGPMHVAAAVGTPVVAIYGSQNAAQFPPYGTGHAVLRPPLPCVNCHAPGRCVPGDAYNNLCVRNVTLDEVRAAVRARLAQVKRS